MMNNITLRIIDLPRTVNAVTVVDDNDDFNIYVNSYLSTIEQQAAYLHEMEHIQREHFWSRKSVESCEEEAKHGRSAVHEI